MAASDARPIPRKGVAYRVYAPILDADGDPVSGATGLDSEVSKDGGAFADCTNEATEIGTSGIYYLDLTTSEMDADAVVVRIQTSSSGAKTSVLVLYPEEAGDIRADVVQISGDSIAADNLETACDGGTYNLGGGGIVAASVTAGVTLAASALAAIWDRATSALTTVGSIGKLIVDLLDAAISSRLAAASYTAPLDGAGTRTAVGLASANLDTQLAAIQADTDNIQTRLPAALVGGRMDASVGAMASDTLTAAALAADAVTEIQSGLATAAAISALDAKVGTPSDLGNGATLAGNLVTIESQTDDIGTAGAGLTAVPWNPAWDAEAQSEVADALAAYDPPTKAELDAAVATLAAEATVVAVGSNVTSILTAVDTEVAAIKAKTDNLPASPAATGDIPTAGSIADAVCDEPLAAHLTAGSVGHALQAARAQGVGKWVRAGNVLTIYDIDGATVVATFDLAPAGGPYTSRTPQ